ncbi:unnamed protein product [Blepharisma stoltei]|uniref:Uncharacterized protein n=1 Tax=Blepharisma stoltei TaxID=1481888 RepID=A0AAU9JGQ8_9CILI|nr:unnamed protein product [Blepharisma stoltei]
MASRAQVQAVRELIPILELDLIVLEFVRAFDYSRPYERLFTSTHRRETEFGVSVHTSGEATFAFIRRGNSKMRFWR